MSDQIAAAPAGPRNDARGNAQAGPVTVYDSVTIPLG
jgi:hypothetical protein